MRSGMALQWSWNVTIEGMNGLGIRPEKRSEMVLKCDQECPGNEAAT